MREAYKDINFRPKSLSLIGFCLQVVEAYQAQGLTLTCRQLYYQLVAANIIPNTEKSYKNITSLISQARLAGLLDWDAIEDRVRQPRENNEFRDLSELVAAALRAYRLPRWSNQLYYAELWVEKDALAGVLAPLASKYHVTMMVNRGYSSQSAMHEAAKRFLLKMSESDYGTTPLLFYLGDLDPSGEDMVRDIEDRLIMFGVDNIEVRKLALTHKQVTQHSLPPNPAKRADPRSQKFIARHGYFSWEVDALPPAVLVKIISDAFEEIIDVSALEKVLKQEGRDKARLARALESLSR